MSPSARFALQHPAVAIRERGADNIDRAVSGKEKANAAKKMKDLRSILVASQTWLSHSAALRPSIKAVAR